MRQQLLIIDDSKPIHTLIKALLADDPVDVHSATDAGYGLILAASMQPDLLLLDVDMPGMNGFEACKELKRNRMTAAVPVIFLTSMSSMEEKLRGLELQAVDYITKPFNRSELLARVRGSLRTSHLIHLLENKAMIDSLTGLGNRAMFDQRLAAEVALRVRFINPLSCIVLDVDSFKSINDTFGHPVGDQALCKVAEVITELCRTEDVACRYGGDEFAIIAPHTTAPDAAVLAERMRLVISKIHFHRREDSIRLTCSFGVADAQNPFDRSMFKRADDALYHSKQTGRNQVSIAAPEARTDAA